MNVETAFGSTDYWVRTPAGWTRLNAGCRHPEFDLLLAHAGVTSWAVITADNPSKTLASPAANRASAARLTNALRSDGYAVMPTIAAIADGTWPPEPGWLALGVTPLSALAIARDAGQAAVLFAQRGAAAEVLYTDDSVRGTTADTARRPATRGLVVQLFRRHAASGAGSASTGVTEIELSEDTGLIAELDGAGIPYAICDFGATGTGIAATDSGEGLFVGFSVRSC